MSTHDLCCSAKIRKNVYPFKPQFDCIKVGYKGYKLLGCVIMMTYNLFNLFITKFQLTYIHTYIHTSNYLSIN